MKRLLVLLALSFPALAATPERLVSDVVWTGAAQSQTAPFVATNGEIGFTAWTDTRDGSSAAYASRIDAGGNVLDPLGVRIATGAVNAVAWNGENFVVVLGPTLVFVAPDMTIKATKTFSFGPLTSFAAMTSGPDPRLLYVRYDFGTGLVAFVVHGNGDTDNQPHALMNPAGWVNGVAVAGGSDDGFLVLREIRENFPGTGRRIVAHRLDRDGAPVSTSDSGLPFAILLGNEAVAGGGDSFLLVTQSLGDDSVVAYALDGAGVHRGVYHALAGSANPVRYLSSYKPAVVREDGRYVVVWHSSYLNGLSEERLAEIGDDGAVSVRQMYQWAGITANIALVSSAGKRFVATSVNRLGFSSLYDVYARSLTPSLQPNDPHLVTASGTMQTNVQIAAGANGFAATWAEAGPDNQVRLFVRRFSTGCVAQDDAPIVVDTFPFDPLWNYTLQAQIVSNGATYLVGWQTTPGFVVRRMDAQTGVWMDAQPLLLPNQSGAELATNGVDGLAVVIGNCGGGVERCLVSARIPMSSAAPDAPKAGLRVTSSSQHLSVASDGAGYLVAWTDPVECFFDPCLAGPNESYAARLRADGTAIDGAPLLLDSGERHPFQPTVAFAGDRYLVVWDDRGSIRGARVTTGGVAVDRDSVLLAQGSSTESFTVRALAFDGRFALVLGKSQYVAAAAPVPQRWEVVAFPPNIDLAAVPSLPRNVILDIPNGAFSTLAATARDGSLGVVYSRVGEPSAGDVARAFLRVLAPSPPRRRPAMH